jgi:hypothetical protein
MKIIKLLNGNVELRNDTGQFIKSLLDTPIEIVPTVVDNAVKVRFADGSVETIEVVDITATQIEPAGEVVFPATADKFYLASLLSGSFFFSA